MYLHSIDNEIAINCYIDVTYNVEVIMQLKLLANRKEITNAWKTV